MSDMVKVKDVGSESIYVREITTYDGRICVVAAIATISTMVFACVVFPPPTIEHLFGFAICLIAAVIIVTSLYFINWIYAFPAIEVFIPGNALYLTIPKTTPVETEREVCKAVQQLVSIAEEIARKKRELQDIAGKCK